MPSHGQIAAEVRRNKERTPQDYCAVPECLWRTRIAAPEDWPPIYCPKHRRKVNDPERYT